MKMYRMNLSLCLLFFFVLSNCLVNSTQPYFPEQVIFSVDNNETLIVIDEVNQRAYLELHIDSQSTDVAYVMQHMPYAKSDSPQAEHYVQLITTVGRNLCSFETYWQYSSNSFGLFPSHWGNDSSYRIKNYLDFNYPMIHSNKSSANEDYWYTNQTCQTDGGDIFPCQEIYFKKNTDIPMRYAEVVLVDTEVIRQTRNFTIYSTSKPSDKYFDSIPKKWYEDCRDGDLEVLYNPTEITLHKQQSIKVEIWLPAPLHEIHGNDTVVIDWISFLCRTCFTWTPKQLVFNRTNFHEKQTLIVTRLENSDESFLIPSCRGGGYDNVPCYIFTLPIY